VTGGVSPVAPLLDIRMLRGAGTVPAEGWIALARRGFHPHDCGALWHTDQEEALP
jgi:hypothetical protein